MLFVVTECIVTWDVNTYEKFMSIVKIEWSSYSTYESPIKCLLRTFDMCSYELLQFLFIIFAEACFCHTFSLKTFKSLVYSRLESKILEGLACCLLELLLFLVTFHVWNAELTSFVNKFLVECYQDNYNSSRRKRNTIGMDKSNW